MSNLQFAVRQNWLRKDLWTILVQDQLLQPGPMKDFFWGILLSLQIKINFESLLTFCAHFLLLGLWLRLKPGGDLLNSLRNWLRKWRVRKNIKFSIFYANAPFLQQITWPIYVSRTQALLCINNHFCYLSHSSIISW